MRSIEYARSAQADALERLITFLRIPSVSTDPERQGEINKAADWLADRLRQAGADGVRIDPTARHPVVYGEWLGAGENAPTILIYGHYDVQPPDPLDLWESPPFEPSEREGFLYARGASDDKGQLMTHVEALEAFLKSGEAPPVNLKFVFEGEEEIGSPNLEVWLRENADALNADVAVISDSAILSPDQPSIVYGLRGLAYLEIEVTGPPGDLHSGIFGGATKNPASALAEILASLHDENGRITVPGFYDSVRPLLDDERAALAKVPFDLGAFQTATGQSGGWGESEYSLVERLGARPTLDINGMWSGFTGEGAKTVLPSKAYAKVSMRLVPDQSPDEINALFKSHIESLAPEGSSVEVRALHGGWPAIIDRDLPAMRAASRAYAEVFGAPPVFTREGGTIPVVALLDKILNLPTVMLGFGLPGDNLHAPNERFSIDQYHRGVETSIRFMSMLREESA